MESEYKSTYFRYEIQQVSSWVHTTQDNNKKETLSYCFVTFTAPAMELRTRSCYTNEVRRCSDSWEDAEVKAQCEAYTARLYSGRDTYRNRHGLLCNNLDVPEPCYYITAKGGHGGSHILPFSMLHDWRRLKRGACASSEIYDPLSCVCRNVFIWTVPKICKNFPSSLVTARS